MLEFRTVSQPEAKTIDQSLYSADDLQGVEFRTIDAPSNVVFDQDNNRTLGLPQSLSDTETNFVIKRDVDEVKNFFGMEDVGGFEALGRGVASFFVAQPQAFGGLVKEQAELTKAPKKQGDFQIASAPDMMMDAAKAAFGAIRKFSIDNLVGADELNAKTDLLIARNKKYMADAGLERPEQGGMSGFMYDLGQGGGSLLTALGLAALTRSPTTASVYFGAMQKSSVYQEARNAGKDPEDASDISTTAGMVEGGLEFVGLDYFMKALKGNSAVKRFVNGFVVEFLQEGSQGVGEEAITQVTGIRDKGAMQTAEDILYQAALGGILGGPVNMAVGAFVKDQAVSRGIDETTADNMATYAEKNIGMASQNITEFIDKELAPIARDEKSAQEFITLMQKFGNDVSLVERDSLDPQTRAVFDQYVQLFDESVRNPQSIKDTEKTFYDQAVKAGVDKDQAVAASKLIGARADAASRALGITPAQWLESKKLEIMVEQEPDRVDAMLDHLRGNKPMKQAERKKTQPILSLLKKRGGVQIGSPLAGELKSMGITPKTNVGLFKKQGGVGAVDNITADVFEGIGQPEMEGDYVSQQWILDRIRDETFGETLGQEENADDAVMDDLAREISERGYDLNKLTNAQVKTLLANDRDDIPFYQGQSKTLDDVKSAWDELGIDYSIYEKNGTITLSKIALPKNGRGQGAGTNAMRALVEYADISQQRIVLTPSTDFGGSSKSRLIDFYKRFGFVENKGRNKDFTTQETMIREPSKTLYQRGEETKTDSPEFKAWFGDSKVVDENGKPLVVYHGGFEAGQIEEFSKDYGGQTTGNNEHGAFHFTDNHDVAEDYSRQSFNRRFQDDTESLVDNGFAESVPEFSDYKDQYAYVEAIADERAAKDVQSVYLKIENPIVLDLEGERVDVGYIERITQFAMNGTDENSEFDEYYDMVRGKFSAQEIEDYREDIEQRARDNFGLDESEEIEAYQFDEAADEVLSEYGFEPTGGKVDGIIIKNMVDDIGEKSRLVADQFIVFDPSQVKSVNNRGTFDPNDARILYQPAKGSITFGQERTLVNLFRNANPSTLLHELGHLFLRDMRDIAKTTKRPLVRKDYETVKQWLGAKGDKLTVAQEEKFARGFEQYLREGKAPKQELQSIFDRFKQWLETIYQSAKDLNVELSPEIRAVFDRMLGADYAQAETLLQEEGRSKIEGDYDKIANEPDKSTLLEDTAYVFRDAGNLAADAFVPVSTRLGKIDLALKHAVRRFVFNTGLYSHEDRVAVKPFVEAVSDNFTKEDYKIFDLALKNRDTEKVDYLVDKYKIRSEWEAVRSVLDGLYMEAKDVGIDLNYIEEYFPRHVKNNMAAEYIAAMEKKDSWSEIELAMREVDPNNTFTYQEKAEFVNNYLRGFSSATINLSKPSFSKERNVDYVEPEFNKYYDDSMPTLIQYIAAMRHGIESRKLFGKSETDTDQNIGAYVLGLIKEGTIRADQEKELKKLLKAVVDPTGTHGIVSWAKNASYIYLMGNSVSAITQIQDLAFSLHKNGYWRTTVGLAKSLTGNQLLKKEDLGLDNILQEFEGNTRASSAVKKVFTAVGLSFMDNVGKEVYIDAAYSRLVKINKKGGKEYDAYMDKVFGKEAAQTKKDLTNGVMSENVKYLLFSELSDVQPISLAEMPVHYLNGGNGRIFYQLKTYTMKQFDIYRREVFDEIASGDPKRMAMGLKNLISLATALMLMGMGTDALKDFILGRDTDLDENIMNNILKVFGVNKYQIYKAKTEGIMNTFWSWLFVPPVGAPIDNLAKDIGKVKSGKMEAKDAQTLGQVPVVGKFYYWWWGGGQAKTEKKHGKHKVSTP